MKIKLSVRMTSMVLLLVMMLSPLSALADKVTSNGSYVQTYISMDYDNPTDYKARVNEQEVSPPVNGWYYVYAQGWVYVPAIELSNVDATPTPMPTVTLAPGVTPSPTPATIDGEKDTTFQGTVLSYMVPLGGLWLYDKVVDGKAVQSVAYGVTLKLTEVGNGWYSVYTGGKTYYVPESILYVEMDDNLYGTSSYSVQSVFIKDETVDDKDSVYLYTAAYDTEQYKTSNTLQRGTRVNARYYMPGWYTYTLGSTTYFFKSQYIDDGKSSSATVSSNEDVTLMREITFSNGVRLYRAKDKNGDYIDLSGKNTLYGIKLDSEWYKVLHSSEVFYVNYKDILESDITETSHAVNESGNTSTYLVSVGSSGARLFTTPTINLYDSSKNSIAKTLPAGLNIYATPLNSLWYTYSETDGTTPKVYYIYYTDIGSSTSTGAMSSYKIYLTKGTELFDKMTAGNPADINLPKDDYYVVQSVNDTWYSIVYDGSIYYIRKENAGASSSEGWNEWVVAVENAMLYDYADNPGNPTEFKISGSIVIRSTSHEQTLPISPSGKGWYTTMYGNKRYFIDASDITGSKYTTSDVEQIATTVEGKQYYVTIGPRRAMLYLDSTCTDPADIYLQPGELILATKYTSTLYIVQSLGAKYYLPVGYISSIRGGDDASAQSTDTAGESISDILAGETNTAFGRPVLSHFIQSGGLWLYYEKKAGAAAINLNYGTTIRLTEDETDKTWYTTWYGGRQYYVPAASLVVSDDNTTMYGFYSIKLQNTAVLYTNPYCTSESKSSLTLETGARVNVQVSSKNTLTGVIIYSYTHFSGVIYYFKSINDSDAPVVEADSTLNALMDSNTNVNFISKFTMTLNGPVKLYTSPKKTSSYSEVNFDVDLPLVLYGVTYDKEWYKVIYKDATWYLFKEDFQAKSVSAEPEQMSITNDVGSTTYTVVIGAKDAPLYSTPNNLTTNLTGKVLDAGTSVLASRYNLYWYTYTREDLKTYYFESSLAVNAGSNEAVSSYRITIPDGTDPIPLYSTVSKTASPINDDNYVLTAGKTYTLRKINTEWSSVSMFGGTYYLKNAALPQSAIDASTPMASTSVGNSYTITTSAGTKVYSDSKLKTQVGTLTGGYQTKGTKMYEANMDNLTSPPYGLIYAVTYNGRTCYISASDVVGIMEGDEVTEAQQAAEQAQNQNITNIAVGTSLLQTFNAGTSLYTSKTASTATFILPSTMIVKVTKEDANWYSLVYNNTTYYAPVSYIESSTGTTETKLVISVGESYTHTFVDTVPCYNVPETWATLEDYILKGEVLVIRKINDKWYEVTYEGKTLYLKVVDVTLPTLTTITTPTTGITHDGTGYITPMISITVTSGSVNMRKSASTSSVVLDRIPNGTQVVNNGYTVDDNGKVWYKITYKNQTGYVIGDYVSPVGTVSGSASADPSMDIGKSFAVNTANVNVRSGPGMKYSIVGRLEKNTMVTPIDYSIGDDNLAWYKFQYNATTTAYIRSDYLAGSAATTSEQSGNVAIRAGGTNMRSGPGDSFSVVEQLAKDVIVTIIGKGTDSSDALWYRISYGNKDGYVRHDLVRPLTAAEQSSLLEEVLGLYTELRSGSKGDAVLALQQQLIRLGYMAAGTADGVYGNKTIEGVKAFQASEGLSQTGVATRELQAQIFNKTVVSSGSTQSLDWFTTGYTLINANKNVTIFDIQTGMTWNARYINGSNHADVIPASKADASKLTANNITGSYLRRPVIVNIAGTNFAGSMYAVGHGTTNYCDYFKGVMCIHFTGSKTHGSNNVDSDHQNAIREALAYDNTK